MSGRLPKIDRDGVRTTSLRDRERRLKIADDAEPHHSGASLADLFAGLAAPLATGLIEAVSQGDA